MAAADADVDRSNAARQSEGQRMMEAIKGRAADYAAQQVMLHACVLLNIMTARELDSLESRTCPASSVSLMATSIRE